jgi:hypothetical protein
MTVDGAPAQDRFWEAGWAGHESAQRGRLARLPLALKLEWLEETQRLIERIQATRRPAPGDRPKAPSDT